MHKLTLIRHEKRSSLKNRKKTIILTGGESVCFFFFSLTIITMANKPQPIAVETPNEDQTSYEQKNVHEVYEVIATHFSDTRYKVWLYINV